MEAARAGLRANQSSVQEKAGGARACALEPTRTADTASVDSSQTTRWYWRCKCTKTGRGGSITAVPPCPAAQNAQQSAWESGVWEGMVCPSEALIPEQIEAMASGSETACATARNAPIGAINCTRTANSTIGMKNSSRRRMSEPAC